MKWGSGVKWKAGKHAVVMNELKRAVRDGRSVLLVAPDGRALGVLSGASRALTRRGQVMVWAQRFRS